MRCNERRRDGNESRSEALVDLNRDGKLDWVRGAQGQNFTVDFGDGTGKFTADSMLIAQPQGNALDAGMMFADLDGDGYEDMIINWGGYSSPDGGDDYGRVRVLMNDGHSNLVEKTTEIGLPTDHLAILGAGDIDQDGDVDLIGLDDRQFPEVIYGNDGHGHFSVLSNAVTGVTGSSEYALWGLATITDLDNDGIADILIDGRYFFHVLRGTGGGHFVYQNDAWGNITHTAETSVDSGFAFGDIDGGGDLDVIAFTSGDPNRQIALYRNDLPAQRWLNVRPVGLPGNRGGVNSKIRVYEPNSDHLLWFEEVMEFSKQAQQNYYAFDALERHYGLGSRDSVDVTVTLSVRHRRSKERRPGEQHARRRRRRHERYDRAKNSVDASRREPSRGRVVRGRPDRGGIVRRGIVAGRAVGGGVQSPRLPRLPVPKRCGELRRPGAQGDGARIRSIAAFLGPKATRTIGSDLRSAVSRPKGPRRTTVSSQAYLGGGAMTVWQPVSTSTVPPVATVPQVVVQRRIWVGFDGLS